MKSQRIAVAGGTGKLGRHIVEGFLEIKQQYRLEIIVLSRSEAPDISYSGASAPVVAVNYQNIDSIRKVLDNYQIDTIISTISRGGQSPEALVSSQENLLRAALLVSSFRRFAPSEFAIDSEQIQATVKRYAAKAPILRSLQQTKRERPDSFEYTRFSCGVFMNYLGYGNPRPEGYKAHGHLAHLPYIFDLSKQTADIPGDGEKQIVYTRVEDVGKFVAAATQLEAWEEYNDMAGEVLTLNQVIRISEEICGVEFNVKYNSREDILARMKSAQTVMESFYLEFMIAFIDGDCDVKRSINLNKLVDVKPMVIREYLQQWWC